MPHALKVPLLAHTSRAPRPACQTMDTELSEVANNLRIARCTIETIGTDQCRACGKPWMLADFPNDAEIEAVGSQLRHFAQFIENHVSEASGAL